MSFTADRPLDGFINESFSQASADPVTKILQKNLYGPVESFLARPKKSMRKELIRIGQLLGAECIPLKQQASPDQQNLRLLLFSNLIEELHSGSLIIDDIEDQSAIRRGAPTLHRMVGLPVALNAGNWLYFAPFMKTQESPLLPSAIKNQCLQDGFKTLYLAHQGQAVDIGASLEELTNNEIIEVVLYSTRYKSGALTALALQLGLLTVMEDLNELNLPSWQALHSTIEEFGFQFGQLLQFFDDIGNLSSRHNTEKQFEDIRLKRPSFIWLTLAHAMTNDELQSIIGAISASSDNAHLTKLMETHRVLELSRAKVQAYRTKWFHDFYLKMPNLSENLKQHIFQLLERLSHAY